LRKDPAKCLGVRRKETTIEKRHHTPGGQDCHYGTDSGSDTRLYYSYTEAEPNENRSGPIV